MARSLVDLEMTVAEGPCTQSLSDDLMVNESDLTSADASRWMLFSPQAMVLGARAVFGFPVRIGVIRLGVLCLYSDEVRDLSEEQMTDALLMSAVVRSEERRVGK